MRSTLILDTNVWLDAVDDRAFVQGLRRARYAVAVADEAVHELVARLASAAADLRSSEKFERYRQACGLAAAHATCPLAPIGVHLALLVGYQTASRWDVRRILHAVAQCRSPDSLERLLRAKATRGEGAHDWKASLDARRSDWTECIRAAITTVAPELLSQNPPSIHPHEYARLLRAEDVADEKLVRIEVEELKRAVLALGGEVRGSDTLLNAQLRPHLGAYLQIFRAAYLDRYSGRHNDGRKRVKLEGNDFNDLAQIRYVQTGRRWVTSDRVWSAVAKQTDFPDAVVHPLEVLG